MLVQCCVCHAVRVDDQWRAPVASLMSGAAVSHSYCPDCAARALHEMRRLRELERSGEAHVA